MLDTYWSDHCRHTTFLTNIEDVEITEGKYHDLLKRHILIILTPENLFMPVVKLIR